MTPIFKNMAYGFSIATVSFFFSLGEARATDTHTGPNTVGSVVCNGANQYCSFVMNGGRSNQPSCAGSDTTFIFQTNTEGGRALLSVLLTSKTSGYSINVYGTGTCATSTLGIAEEWVDYIVTP